MTAAGGRPAEGGARIRCRVVACREALPDDQSWSFYLLNDGDAPLDAATLTQVTTEWGDRSHTRATDARVAEVAPGRHARIWRDDGELRLELVVDVRAGGRAAQLCFEFPRLHRQAGLPHVAELGVPGFAVAVER